MNTLQVCLGIICFVLEFFVTYQIVSLDGQASTLSQIRSLLTHL
uniref:Uncharacterized protein n=1 Tax=Anguilla anguilla TaxID=7936 RepID=A0A0E9QRP1_ANGAN